MQEVPFGRTGLSVSPLGFGGAEIGVLKTSPTEAASLLNGLLDRGINVIDTAACYHDSEIRIGQAIAGRRDQFVLISKYGHSVDGVTGAEWSPEVILQTFDRALDRLATDVLDVMLLHSCSIDVLREGAAWQAMQEAKARGSVRHIGYSGDNEAAAFATTLDDLDVIQTSVNMCDQMNIDGVLGHCVERNIGVMAKRPIANAAWRTAAQQPGAYANYAGEYTRRLSLMDIAPSRLGWTDDDPASWAEFALRFTLSQPGVSTAIIGTTNLSHVEHNIRSVEAGPLDADVVDRIRAAFEQARSANNGDWSGQT